MQIRKQQGSPVFVCPLQVKCGLRCQLCIKDMRTVLKLNCTMLNIEPVREFARLQETVGKEAHVVTPPIWHAGRIEIGYHESLIGG